MFTCSTSTACSRTHTAARASALNHVSALRNAVDMCTHVTPAGCSSCTAETGFRPLLSGVGREGANFYSGEYVCVNEHESRTQLVQSGCSVRVTRCLCAPVPANGFGLVCRNASLTVLVTKSDIEQCCRMSLGGSKLVQPQRFSLVLSNAKALVVHVAQAALCPIKVLRCSQPIQRKSLGAILRNASFTPPIKPAERALPVSAALP